MSPAIQLLVPLITILIGARLVGLVSTRIGLPAVFGELMVGVVLGPSLLNWIHLDEPLRVLSELGVILLMFIAGVETDMVQMRDVGKGAFLTAVGGVALPFMAGYGLAVAFGFTTANALFVGALLTATSVSISVQVLSELGHLKSRVGMTILGAAVIDDVLGILVLSIVLGFSGGTAPLTSVLHMALYLGLALVVGRFAVPVIGRWIHRHHSPEVGLALILGLVLVYAWSAEALGGMAAITGAYLIGVLVGQVDEVRHWVVKGASHIGYGFLVPIFFVGIGLEMQPTGLGDLPMFTLLLVGLAIVTKIIGCGLGARASGRPMSEAVMIGCGMVGRGEVALVMASIGLGSGRIDNSVFAATVLMALVTTLVTPLLLKFTLAERPAGGLAEATLPAPPAGLDGLAQAD
ncbi:MAG: cation:proton antiporter [Anaerolineae bacterium]|nr:cation:proton antiporter [Anaerolineae bacterium]